MLGSEAVQARSCRLVSHINNTEQTMKTIAMTIPLAASLLLGSAAVASSPRVELLAGASRSETVIEVRHDQGSHNERHIDGRHGSRHDNRHDNRRGSRHDNRYDNRPGYGYDNRGRNGDYQYRQARRYAAEAVDQAREARQFGFYPDHPRWSLNFERHFNWALGASERALQREHYRRTAQLRKWRHQAAYYEHNRYGYRQPY